MSSRRVEVYDEQIFNFKNTKGGSIKVNDNFWSKDEYFVSPPLTENSIVNAEKRLGYKLPQSYISLIKTQNGGTPRKTCFPTNEPTSWAEDHIAIEAILGIGGKWGIDSEEFGSDFMIHEWGYPDIGIVICECTSAGHDAVMLDYSKCGKRGEPQVIHVDVEVGEITFLAHNFKEFIEGLVDESQFD